MSGGVTGPDGVRYSSEFERHLGMVKKGSGAALPFHDALIDVADTAYGCLLWFQSNGMTATAADVVAMTKLVLDRVPTPQGGEGE